MSQPRQQLEPELQQEGKAKGVVVFMTSLDDCMVEMWLRSAAPDRLRKLDRRCIEELKPG